MREDGDEVGGEQEHEEEMIMIGCVGWIDKGMDGINGTNNIIIIIIHHYHPLLSPIIERDGDVFPIK